MRPRENPLKLHDIIFLKPLKMYPITPQNDDDIDDDDCRYYHFDVDNEAGGR